MKRLLHALLILLLFGSIFLVHVDTRAASVTIVARDILRRPVKNGQTIESTVFLSLSNLLTNAQLTVQLDGESLTVQNNFFYCSQAGEYCVAIVQEGKITEELKFIIPIYTHIYCSTADYKPITNGARVAGAVLVQMSSSDQVSDFQIFKDGVPAQFPSSGYFTQPGSYEVLASAGGSSTSATFVITHFLQIYTIYNNNNIDYSYIYNNEGTTQNVTLLLLSSDYATLSAQKDGKFFPVQQVSSAAYNFELEGNYTIQADNSSGDKLAYAFCIDRTPPVVQLISNKKPLNSGSYTRTDVTLTLTERNIKSTVLIRDGKTAALPNGFLFHSDGTYKFIATDRAGNRANCTFVLDKTLPTIRVVSSSKKTLISGQSVHVSYALITVSDKYLHMKAATRNGKVYPWPKTNKFSIKGSYSVTARDKAGNVRTFRFTLK